MIINDPLRTVQTLNHLKDLGVSLSLDDFSTGYFSLNYLRKFPVDTLKIDQSFIRDVMIDSSEASVVISIIDIAHNLKLTAIAEGVKTSEQLYEFYQQKIADCDQQILDQLNACDGSDDNDPNSSPPRSMNT